MRSCSPFLLLHSHNLNICWNNAQLFACSRIAPLRVTCCSGACVKIWNIWISFSHIIELFYYRLYSLQSFYDCEAIIIIFRSICARKVSSAKFCCPMISRRGLYTRCFARNMAIASSEDAVPHFATRSTQFESRCRNEACADAMIRHVTYN